MNGTDPHNRLYVADLGDPMHPNVAAPVKPLFDKPDAAYSPIGNVGSTIYMSTDNGAPKYTDRRVRRRASGRDELAHRRARGEERHRSQSAMFKDRIAVNYLEDVKSSVHVFALDGKPARTTGAAGRRHARRA